MLIDWLVFACVLDSCKVRSSNPFEVKARIRKPYENRLNGLSVGSFEEAVDDCPHSEGASPAMTILKRVTHRLPVVHGFIAREPCPFIW